MHPESHALMKQMLDKANGDMLQVLDVGSLDVNGSFRPLVEGRGWLYTGLDLQAGANVDVVADDPYWYPLVDNSFDVVMSGSTMEHVKAIWLWLPELVRLIKPGGWLLLHTHWSFPEHRYPVDCWRIMPDGMRFLFDETGLLEDYWIEIVNSWDIGATARKVRSIAVKGNGLFRVEKALAGGYR